MTRQKKNPEGQDPGLNRNLDGLSPVSVLQRLRSGDRRLLAKMISRACGTKRAGQQAIWSLLRLGQENPGHLSLRIGLSGAPGAGKSTLIEHLGLLATAQGLSVAVLSIDPSSRKSGGAVLGDKSRMPALAAHPRAFVRPEASGADASGLITGIQETLDLIELAGFGLTVIEAVGSGQIESGLADVCDYHVLVLSPDSGDALQSIKKGALESADMLVVTKCDQELQPVAMETARAFHHSCRQVFTVSALAPASAPDTLESLLAAACDWWRLAVADGTVAAQRRRRRRRGFERRLQAELAAETRAFVAAIENGRHALSAETAVNLASRIALSDLLAKEYARL